MSGGLADAVIARVVKQRDLMQAMDEHCRSIQVRMSSADQSVSVEVDGFGAMTGLHLAPTAYRHGADALADLIVSTAHAAATLAAERQQFLLREFTVRLGDLAAQPLTRWDGTTVHLDRGRKVTGE
ncbi:hypothetical protein FZI94_22850 [Mycobacterium sp. CBMA226]|nr:hypothetical protein [Mycolicibacterium sp. CBMA 226]QGW61181.1 Nucleoid-associated protein YbaB [Mycolicibacterium sp.]